MRSKITHLVLLLGAALLGGCGGGDEVGGSSNAAPRLEAFCQYPNLAPPLRQTILLADERSIVRGADPAQIRAANLQLFNLALALGEPGQSVSAGVMAPRERLSVLIAPANGAAPRLIFTGCIPAIGADEMKRLNSGKTSLGSASDSYFGTGAANKVQEASEEFQQALLGALVNASRNASTERKAAADVVSSSLSRALAAAPQLSPPEYGVPRLFILTDLATFSGSGQTSAATARAAGFAAAETARLSFGRAEVHLVGDGGGPFGRDFADAFVLGSQGALQSWGATTFSNAPAIPVRLTNYSGKIDYDGIDYPVQMRLATDRTGTLVDSWIVVKLDREFATPVTGAVSCDTGGRCKLNSDQGGLAQVWSKNPDPAPEFDADMPLGGLRYIEADVSPDTLDGKVFDTSIDRIGKLPGSVGLRFHMTRSP